MESRQTARLKISYRPVLGDVAIAACVAGGIAALSTAGIALPVERIGFAGDWSAKSGPSDRQVAGLAAPKKPVKATSFPRPSFDPAPVLTDEPLNLARIVPTAPLRLEPVSALQRIRELQEPKAAPLAALPAVPPAIAAPSLVVPTESPIAEPELYAGVVRSAEITGHTPLASAPDSPQLAIINTPELKGFDLARVGSSRKVPSAGLATASAAKPATASVQTKPGKDRVEGEEIFHQISLSVAGSQGQSVEVRIGADMKPSLKVGDLIGLVSDRMDPDSAARFSSAAAAGEFVSLATLRAAGFDVAYNAGANSIAIEVAN